MVLTKIAKRNPREIASCRSFRYKAKHVKQVDIAGPGFINFYLDNQYLTDIIPEAITKVIDLDMQHNLRILTFY